MKFALTIITILCLYHIIPTHSRFDIDVYSTGNTVYRGVIGCGTMESGQVIYDPPENAQAYESWTIPVEGAQCRITLSSCFDSTGDPIAFAGFEQLDPDWTNVGETQNPGNCPDAGDGPDNTISSNFLLSNFVGNAQCQADGSISGLLLVRIGTTTVDGSANYTFSLECNDDCNECTIDPALDELQQLEDAKDAIDCDLAETVCDSPEDSPDSPDSDSSGSSDDARSELERMDEHDIMYTNAHNKKEDGNDHGEKTYLLKVAQSVWINMYSFLALMILSCALFCVCMHRKK